MEPYLSPEICTGARWDCGARCALVPRPASRTAQETVLGLAWSRPDSLVSPVTSTSCRQSPCRSARLQHAVWSLLMFERLPGERDAGALPQPRESAIAWSCAYCTWLDPLDAAAERIRVSHARRSSEEQRRLGGRHFTFTSPQAHRAERVGRGGRRAALLPDNRTCFPDRPHAAYPGGRADEPNGAALKEWRASVGRRIICRCILRFECLACALGGAAAKLPVVYEVRAFWEDAAADHGRIANGGCAIADPRSKNFALRRAGQVTTICGGTQAGHVRARDPEERSRWCQMGEPSALQSSAVNRMSA